MVDLGILDQLQINDSLIYFDGNNHSYGIRDGSVILDLNPTIEVSYILTVIKYFFRS